MYKQSFMLLPTAALLLSLLGWADGAHAAPATDSKTGISVNWVWGEYRLATGYYVQGKAQNLSQTNYNNVTLTFVIYAKDGDKMGQTSIVLGLLPAGDKATFNEQLLPRSVVSGDRAARVVLYSINTSPPANNEQPPRSSHAPSVVPVLPDLPLIEEPVTDQPAQRELGKIPAFDFAQALNWYRNTRPAKNIDDGEREIKLRRLARQYFHSRKDQFVFHSRVVLFGADDLTSEFIKLDPEISPLALAQLDIDAVPIGYVDTKALAEQLVNHPRWVGYSRQVDGLKGNLSSDAKESIRKDMIVRASRLVAMAAERVALQQGLVAILDKEAFSYGGYDVTSSVVKNLFLTSEKNSELPNRLVASVNMSVLLNQYEKSDAWKRGVERFKARGEVLAKEVQDLERSKINRNELDVQIESRVTEMKRLEKELQDTAGQNIRAAIAAVAKKQRVRIVLDGRMVVCGSVDLTERVANALP